MESKDSNYNVSVPLVGVLGSIIGWKTKGALDNWLASKKKEFARKAQHKDAYWEVTHKSYKKVLDHIAKKYGIDIRLQRSLITPTFIARPKEKAAIIRSPQNLFDLAQRGGRAVDVKNLYNAKVALKTYSPILGLVGSTGLLLSGDEDKAKYAPAVYVAGYLPKLYLEGKSNIIGLKAIKDVLGKAQALKASKPLIYSYLRSLNKALLPAAGIYAANELRKFVDKKNK